MRTTLTLEPDVEQLVRRTMRERGMSFKQAINDGLRAGLGRPGGTPPAVPTRRMGEPLVDVTKALQVAGELEDQERARRFSVGR